MQFHSHTYTYFNAVAIKVEFILYLKKLASVVGIDNNNSKAFNLYSYTLHNKPITKYSVAV
jgi:hypothetical protein